MPAFTNDRQTDKNKTASDRAPYCIRAQEERIGFEARHHCQSPRLPHSAWEDCNLTELAGQLGNMVKQTIPVLRGCGSPCRLYKFAWVGILRR